METRTAFTAMIKTMIKDLWKFCKRAKWYNPIAYMGLIVAIILSLFYGVAVFCKQLFTKGGFLMFVVGIAVGIILGYYLEYLIALL
jgi:hypothetical protein